MCQNHKGRIEEDDRRDQKDPCVACIYHASLRLLYGASLSVKRAWGPYIKFLTTQVYKAVTKSGP